MNQTQEQLENFIGKELHSSSGDKIGRISDIYLDDATKQPEWIAVHTGFFGTNVSFVPMVNISMDDDAVVAPFEASQVKDAPKCEADGSLSQDEEAQLYSHYGLNYSESSSDSGLPSGGDAKAKNEGGDTSGPNTDSAMTRSEQEMVVGKQTNEAGRVRLRKYVVTEHQTMTVPVMREKIRIEREPITDANYDQAMSGPEISEEEHEIVLHEEEAVVGTRTVPKERVRLATEQVTEQQQVSADIAKERIEVDEDNTRK